MELFHTCRDQIGLGRASPANREGLCTIIKVGMRVVVVSCAWQNPRLHTASARAILKL